MTGQRAIALGVCILMLVSGRAVNAAVEHEPFYIVKDGRGMAAVALTAVPPNDARDIVKAVELFREDVAECFNVDVPFDAQRGGPNRIELVVEARSLETEDEVVIDFPEQRVMRITGGKTGVMRSLFYLLEEFAGVRYLYQGGTRSTHYPVGTAFAVPRQTIQRDAAYPLGRLSNRTDGYFDRPSERRYFWWWEAKLGAKAPLRYNHALTSGPEPPARWERRLHEVAFPLRDYARATEKPADAIFPILHGERYLPYQHLSGTRAPHGWQPCFSSRAAVDEAADNLIEFLEQHPDVKSLPLGVNDNGGHCECSACEALDKLGGDHNAMGYRDHSESYYRWLNQVVGRVAERFPQVKFGVIAYREVLEPPTVMLHSNVVPVLCFDFNAVIDPEVAQVRKDLIENWAAKAHHLGFWAYDPGFYVFTLPRVYFREQQAMIRFMRDHKGDMGFSSGGYYFTANEGPKAYLHFKLTENPDLDLEAAIQDWCNACVGEEAGVYLRAYYRFWEEFWREKATKTPWWDTRRGVYLNRKLFGSYMYGLEPGDMASCREIMEKVVAVANEQGTEDQQTRAALQMRCFEWHEAAAEVCAAELHEADASLRDAAAAADLVRKIPEALRSFERWKEIPEKTTGWYAYNLVQSQVDAGIVADTLMSVSEYAGDLAVNAELTKLAANRAVESGMRFLAKILAQGADAEIEGNMLSNGSLEQGADHGWATTHGLHGGIERVEGVAASGTHALRCDIEHNNYTVEKIVYGAEPDTPYYFAARVFVPKDQQVNLEGRMEFWGNPATKGRNRTWPVNIPEIRLAPGKWNYVSAVVPAHSATDSLGLRFRLKNFEYGAVVYVDDLTLLPIP